MAQGQMQPAVKEMDRQAIRWLLEHLGSDCLASADVSAPPSHESPTMLGPVGNPVIFKNIPPPIPSATPWPDPVRQIVFKEIWGSLRTAPVSGVAGQVSLNFVDGASFEDWDNIIGNPEVEPEPLKFSVVNPTPVPSAPSDQDGVVQLDGMVNIAGDSDAPNASGSPEQRMLTDDVRIATTPFALAQALSVLGLHDYALTTSSFALDALQRPYSAKPNNARLHVASVLLDRSAAVAFELLSELDKSWPDTKGVLALCKLCVSTSRIRADNGMATSMADETIDLTRMSLDANSQTALAGALLAKSKALSSKHQNNAASTVSAEAVTLLRSMSVACPVFSLFLAHALDTHAHHLSEANCKGEPYSVGRDAVEHWRMLKATPGGAVARPLAWSLFELAKFRRKGAGRQSLREELRIAESADKMFREAEPLDAFDLGDVLYLCADRMLEPDRIQEAGTYAEESVRYFREAASEDPKYAIDLIFSLSPALACLACTKRDNVALEYAKQAVEFQRGRRGVGDPQYDAHLRKLLMDVVFRAVEMDKPDGADSWYEELQGLGGLDGPLARWSGDKGEDDRFRNQTSSLVDATADAPRSNKGSTISSPVTSSSVLRADKGKGKEVAPHCEDVPLILVKILGLLFGDTRGQGS